MRHCERAHCLREKAAEYRRQARSIEHPTLVAHLLTVADHLEILAVQLEHEAYRPPTAARRAGLVQS